MEAKGNQQLTNELAQVVIRVQELAARMEDIMPEVRDQILEN